MEKDKSLRKYFYAILVILILMGATLGGSIVSFLFFISFAQGQVIGGKLYFLNILAYALLLAFIVLFIIFILLLMRVRIIRLEKSINEQKGNNDNEK